jgi:hypothetical protein
MSKRPGYHDAYIRVPEGLWERFVALVETLSPRRSATQQVVHLIEQFVEKEAPAQLKQETPKEKPRKRKGGKS